MSRRYFAVCLESAEPHCRKCFKDNGVYYKILIKISKRNQYLLKKNGYLDQGLLIAEVENKSNFRGRPKFIRWVTAEEISCL